MNTVLRTSTYEILQSGSSDFDKQNRLTILTITDPVFYLNLKSVVASVLKNHPDCLLWCHLINPTNEEITALKKRPNIKITAEYPKFPNEAAKRGYCCSVRSTMVHNLLQNGYQYILYLDADSIIRKEISGLFELMKSGDITIVKRHEGGSIRTRFNCGIIGFTNTPTTLLFIENWIRKIESLDFYKWLSDQMGFGYTYEDMRGQLNHIQMPLTYHDWEFKETSNIWTGKGATKYENVTFREQERIFQKLFDGKSSGLDLALIKLEKFGWITSEFYDTKKAQLSYFLAKVVRVVRRKVDPNFEQ